MKMLKCYGCGNDTPAEDDVPECAHVWCASCALADIPVLMWEIEHEAEDP